MKSVALITYGESPDLTESDRLLIKPLQDEGFNPRAVAWDDKEIDWTQYDYLVLRSCWNYHYSFSKFLNWLSHLEKIKAKLWNPIPVVRWNADKRYLKDLEKQEVSIPPTIWLDKGTKANLEDVMNDKGWDDVVVKPTVGASVYEVFRIKIDKHNTAQPKLEMLLNKTDVMIQPLMSEVITEGEFSFIFLGGEYSHAMLKRPKKGDFRSNYHCGGKETKVEPDKGLVEQASSVLKKVDSPLLYARIDGINRNGKFILMEIELIEPHLFFDQDPKSPIRFARALKERSVL